MYLAMPFTSPRSARFGTNRAGMSLLEVLVALGVLAAGLASVAALLPAAGARLADATAIDQACALAANTHADLRIRNVLTASMFSGSTPQAVVSGSTIIAFATGTEISVDTRLYPTISLTKVDVRLGVSGTTTEVTDNGVCCGVMVVPVASTTTPITAGMPARVTVATFKQSTFQSQQIKLTAATGTASVLSGSNIAIFTTGSDAVGQLRMGAGIQHFRNFNFSSGVAADRRVLDHDGLNWIAGRFVRFLFGSNGRWTAAVWQHFERLWVHTHPTSG